MCSVQIGREVNKHYFPTEFGSKTTGNLSMRTGKQKQNNKTTQQRRAPLPGEASPSADHTGCAAQGPPCLQAVWVVIPQTRLEGVL